MCKPCGFIIVRLYNILHMLCITLFMLYIFCILMSKLLAVRYIEKYFKFISHPTPSQLLLIPNVSVHLNSQQMASEIMTWYKLYDTCTAETHSWCCCGSADGAAACLVQQTHWQNYAEQYSWATSSHDIAAHLKDGKFVQTGPEEHWRTSASAF